MVGLTHHTSQVYYSQNPCPRSRPLLTCASAGDTQKLKGRPGSVSCGVPGANNGLVPNWERSLSWLYIVTLLTHLYAGYIMQNAGLDET